MAAPWVSESSRDEFSSSVFNRLQSSRPEIVTPRFHAPTRSPFLNNGHRIAQDRPLTSANNAATGFWPMRPSSYSTRFTAATPTDVTSAAFKKRFAASPTCVVGFPAPALTVDATGSLLFRSPSSFNLEWGRNGGTPGTATVVAARDGHPATGTMCSSPPWDHAVGLTQWVRITQPKSTTCSDMRYGVSLPGGCSLIPLVCHSCPFLPSCALTRRPSNQHPHGTRRELLTEFLACCV